MKRIVIVLIAATGIYATNAQSVGIGNTSPDPSAQLDVSSTTKGLLIPRMTTAQRTAIASPASGLMVYETTSNSFWFYNGTVWSQIGTGGASPWNTTGSNIYNSNSGHVGIGTSIGLKEKLSVKGDIFITNVNSNDLVNGGNRGEINLHGASTGGGRINFLNPDTTVGAYINYNRLSSVSNNFTINHGSNISQLSLDINGNVGIGRFSAAQKLDVEGNIRSRQDLMADGKVIATGVVSGSALQTTGNLQAAGIGYITGNFTTNSNLSVGGTSMLTGNVTTAGDIIVNNIGATLQLRNGSNVNTGFFQLSGSNVRMGTNSGNNGQLIIRMNGNDRIRIDQGGNMDIEGQIHNSTISGGAPLLPKCYGFVNSDGTINSGTGNFSVTRETLGLYKITCAGISFNSILLSSVPYQTATSSIFYDSPNTLEVRTWHTDSGTRTDRPFYFLVY